VQADGEPEHGPVRRAPAEDRLGRPARYAGGDDARVRRGRLPRGRVDHRRALVERDRVPVRRQLAGLEPFLRGEAGPLGRAQVELDEVRVGAAGEDVVSAVDEADFREVASIIVDSLDESATTDALRARAVALCDKRPLYPGFRGYTTYR
jgi:hypothetical protein